jgi:hypothetical protein
MSTQELQNAQPERNLFTDLTLGRSVAWETVIGRPFATDQLCINRSPANELVLEWRSMAAIRPHADSPMIIEFAIPEAVITHGTPSGFKSQLLTDFLSCAAGQASEPLRTAFYQELRHKDFQVKSITNGSIAHELQRTFDANSAAFHRCEILWKP